MYKLMTREEMIKKYATNEHEVNYINNLSNEVYEQVAVLIEFIEGVREEVTFKNILEQTMTVCVHTFDFKTNDIIRERFPKVVYHMLQVRSSGSEYNIEMDSNGHVKFNITITAEQHMIMTLLGTWERLEEYFYTEGVANEFNLIIKGQWE